MLTRLGAAPIKYSFGASINATASISKFWFEVDEGDGTTPTVEDNGGSGYVIDQDKVLFDVSRSSQYPSVGRNSAGYSIVVAVRSVSSGIVLY